MRIFILLFMLAPLFLWGQYPDNPRKLRLGFQTTGAGLTYIKDGAPAHTPGDDEDAWMVLDTANNVLYYWDETAGAWENILDDITQDTVFQITNVPDTTTLAPMQGDAFINSTADTLGLYNGAGWVLFFGGSGGGAVSDTTRFFVYAPAHGLEDSISAYGYVPVKADFTKANSSTLDSTHFAYAVGAPHVDTLELKLSGPLVVTAHGLIVGRLYYLQDDGTQAVTPGTVRAPTVYVLDANTVVLTEVGADQDQVISRQAVPSPVFTFWGGDPQNPSDSIMQIVVDSVFVPAGLAKPSTIFFMSYSSQSKNPTYQDDSPTDSPLNPSHSWFYDGNVVTRMNHLLTSVDLQATSAGLFTLDTVQLVDGIPTDSTVANWLDTNYVQNNLRLPNGAILYWKGDGTAQNPRYKWMVIDDITNTGETNDYRRIIKNLSSDPVDTLIIATRTYADSLFAVADSLREAGDRSTPILIQAFDRIIQLDGCSTSETVITGFQLIDDTPIDKGGVTFEIGSPQSITYDVYNADSTSYYFETSVSRTAGIYTWEVGYTDPDGNFVGDMNSFEVVAGTPDTVTVWLNDSISVTRRCGVEISRDTLRGITDGDKGDIDVSDSGATWVIDTGVVGANELASTAVTPGSYTYSSFTVDADGRVTAASSGTTPLTGSLSSGYLPYATGATTLANSTLYRNGSGDIGLNEASPLATFHLQTRAGANALIIEDDNLSTLGPSFYITGPGQTTSGTNGTELFWVVGGPGSGSNLDGPYFAMRGNTYTRLSNQRGHMAFVAGNVSSPVGNDGTVYFLTGSGSTGMALFPTGRMGVNVFPPSYTLDVGGTGTALRLAPSSAPVNAAGVWYTSSGNYPHFMNGTTDWPLVRGAAESFTPGSLLFAGTSGQAQQDNANFFVDDTNNRLGIGTSSPQRTLHVAGEARITDLTTDTPTRIVGADADGDLGEMTAGMGISFAGGQISSTSIQYLSENDTIYVCNDTCAYKTINQAMEYASQFTSPYDSLTGIKTLTVMFTTNSDGSLPEFTTGFDAEGGNWGNILVSATDTVLFNPATSLNFLRWDNSNNIRISGLTLKNQNGNGGTAFYLNNCANINLANVQVDSFSRALAGFSAVNLYWQGGGVNVSDIGVDFANARAYFRDIIIENVAGYGIYASRNSDVHLRDMTVRYCEDGIEANIGSRISTQQNVFFRIDPTKDSTLDLTINGGYAFLDESTGGTNIPFNQLTPLGFAQKSTATPTGYGSASGTTDGSGDITVSHGFATASIFVTATATGTTFYNVQVHSKTSTDFKIRFFDATGAAVTSTAVTADWIAKK